MPRGDFRELADAQRETARNLDTLVSEFRRTSRAGELERLSGGLSPRSRAEDLRRGTIAQVVPSMRTVEPTRGLEGATSDAGEMARAVKLSRDAIGELGNSLAAGTKDLEQTLRGFSGGLQALLAGLAGGGGGGFTGLLKGGFGLASLGLKVAGLFGNKKPEPVTFTPFELPPSLSLEAANTRSVLAGFPRFDRGQAGEPRSFREEGAGGQPQVVVNVNALDTQSFLDRSSDIARAVREAMLHMHPINDMIGEL